MGRVDLPREGEVLVRVGLGFLVLGMFVLISAIAIANITPLDTQQALTTALSLTSGADYNLVSNSESAVRGIFFSLAFGGEVLAFYVFYVIFDFLLSGRLRKAMFGVDRMKKIRILKNHIIICGFGHVGTRLAKRLSENGKKIVVIDRDPEAFAGLDGNLNKIVGDAMDEDILKTARIDTAESIATVMGRDGDNLLLTLTAKELNPNITVASRASDEKMIRKLLHAGADLVVLPEVVGGIKLANALLGEADPDHVIEYNPSNNSNGKIIKKGKKR